MTRTALVSYFFASDALPLGDSLVRGLEANGWKVERFHCQAESPINNLLFKPLRKITKGLGADVDLARQLGVDNDNFRNARLYERLEAVKPDLLLVVRGTDYSKATLDRAKQNGLLGTSVGWWVGGPESAEFLAQDAQTYDHYFSIHPAPLPEGVAWLDLLGHDAAIYHPIPGLAQDVPISFVGGLNPRRLEVFSQLTDLPIQIYGPGWRKPKNGWRPALWRRVKARGIYGDALNRLYNRSKIVLNVTGWKPEAGKGLNLRVLDVPATGAFLLTDFSEDLAAFFKPGEEIETWHSIEELRDKCRFYLANDAARSKIAAAGLERVRKLEDYRSKMARLLAGAGLAGPG
ncbi:glycosyltransferase [Niveibacterium sp. 24ML]|uniref:CgeB family protein n=1 Tax=Niveibacterium sp. 24ML TaxID=2985512 RepID=UPI0022720BA1|nr:glycosyltransferase [Niveibacterium sp. 24ML]MCX9154709.1 glycosyltransferase [Niveibacterium sp. 24ML]